MKEKKDLNLKEKIKNMKKCFILFLVLSVCPLVTFALGEQGQFSKTTRLLESLGNVIGTLIPIVFALGLLVFFWGVVKYIWSSGEGKNEGKSIMLWGVIALFVMASIWGIVAFIGKELDIEEKTEVTIPTIKR